MWSIEEDKFLINNIHLTNDELAKRMGRTIGSIRKRLSKLEIKRPKKNRKEILKVLLTPNIDLLISESNSFYDLAKKIGCRNSNIFRDEIEKLGHDISHFIKPRGKTTKLANYIGLVINNTKILDVYKSGKQYYAKCECICGKIRNVQSSHILNGRINSCGCLRPKTGRGNLNSRWKGFGEIPKSYINSINRGAKSRNLEFSITIEYLWNLFLIQSKRCALSGKEIWFNSIKKDTTASLDRIDSSKGYIEGNVQWVHKDINMMKQNFDEKYFLELCKQIINYKEF